MLLVVILGPQQELHSLGGSVCRRRRKDGIRRRRRTRSASKLTYTVNRRLSTLHQGGSPITAPPSVLVSMVTVFSVAAAPLRTAQRDVNTNIESPVAWRQVCWLDHIHCSVCWVWVLSVCTHPCGSTFVLSGALHNRYRSTDP